MHGGKIRNLRYQNEKLKLENDRLKSQFKYANRGKGMPIPEVAGEGFDKQEMLDRFREHLQKYSQLRRDFRDVKNEYTGVKRTLKEWREVFGRHDIQFEEEMDLE